jgi:hypothetical protein
MCQVIINFFPGYRRRRLIILPTLFRASRLRQNSRVPNKRVGWNKFVLYGINNKVINKTFPFILAKLPCVYVKKSVEEISFHKNESSTRLFGTLEYIRIFFPLLYVVVFFTLETHFGRDLCVQRLCDGHHLRVDKRKTANWHVDI